MKNEDADKENEKLKDQLTAEAKYFTEDILFLKRQAENVIR